MTRFKVAPGRVSKGLNLDFPQPKRQSRRLKRTRCRSPLPCPLARSLFPPTLLSLLSPLFPLGETLHTARRSRNLLVRQIPAYDGRQLSASALPRLPSILDDDDRRLAARAAAAAAAGGMSLDSTTSSTTTDPLGRRPSSAALTPPDVDAVLRTTTTTPSTAPTTPPASPPPHDLPYCSSPQPASAAELPAETEYPPPRRDENDDDDEEDNAPGPSSSSAAFPSERVAGSSKEKRKGGGEGAEGEQVRDKRVRKTRHKRRPSSQHRSALPSEARRGIKTSRVLTSASLRIQCQGDDGRHCVRGRGRQADGQPMWVVPSETPIVESCSVLMTSITPLSRPARTCPRPGRVWDRRAWRRRPDRPHFCAFC